MMQPAAFKICPKCQEAAVLQASFCGQCGRAFRTTAGMQAAPLPTSPLPRFAARKAFDHLSSLSRQAKIGVACALAFLFLLTLSRFLSHTLSMQEALQVEIGMDQATVQQKIGPPAETRDNVTVYQLNTGHTLEIGFVAEHVYSAVLVSHTSNQIGGNLHGRNLYGGGERARSAFPAAYQ